MNTKIKSIIVLTCICLAVSVLLAVTNHFTAPIIAENEAQKKFEACYEVMPDANKFEEVDLSTVSNIPATIKNIYKETSGMGYVFSVERSGYKPGLVIMCGITDDGKITKVTTVSSQETEGIGTQTEDESYTNQYIGKDQNLEGINKISGATITSAAFKGAVSDAFTAFLSLKGVVVEKEEPIDIAMPDAEGFEDITSTLTGLPSTVKTVYKETSGKGYVFEMVVYGYNPGLVIMCGISSDGKVVDTVTVSSDESEGIGTLTEEESYTSQYVGKDENLEGIVGISGATYTSDAYYKAVKDAFTAFAIVNGAEVEPEEKVEPIDIAMPDAEGFEDITSTLTGLPSTVKTVYKETSGKGYVFEMVVYGYNPGLVIMCGISSDGKVIDTVTVSSDETRGIGSLTEEESYTSQYVGKDENLAGIVGISGATYTSNAYYKAIQDAFKAFKLVIGGGANE